MLIALHLADFAEQQPGREGTGRARERRFQRCGGLHRLLQLKLGKGQVQCDLFVGRLGLRGLLQQMNRAR